MKPKHTPYCSCIGCNAGPSRTTDFPNAALIAAAPEMLERLKMAVEFLRNTRQLDSNSETRDGLIDYLSEAIAKAEGRE